MKKGASWSIGLHGLSCWANVFRGGKSVDDDNTSSALVTPPFSFSEDVVEGNRGSTRVYLDSSTKKNAATRRAMAKANST